MKSKEVTKIKKSSCSVVYANVQLLHRLSKFDRNKICSRFAFGFIERCNLKLVKIAGNQNVLLKKLERISEEIFEIYTFIFKGIIWSFINANKKFSSKNHWKYNVFI